MAAFPASIDVPQLVRDMSTDSLTTSCSTLDNWASDETTPATSPPSSRGESPERKLDGASRHARSDTVTALPSAPPVRNICFVGAGFVGKAACVHIYLPARHSMECLLTRVDGCLKAGQRRR